MSSDSFSAHVRDSDVHKYSVWLLGREQGASRILYTVVYVAGIVADLVAWRLKTPKPQQQATQSLLQDKLKQDAQSFVEPEVQLQFYNLHAPILINTILGASINGTASRLLIERVLGLPLPKKYSGKHHIAEMQQIWASLLRAETA